MKEYNTVVWRCDAEGCKIHSYENEDVSPIAFGWCSLELVRSGQPTVSVELCMVHAKEPGANEQLFKRLMARVMVSELP